ncbi:MAG: pyridoxal phosphate-dependent aminotransferase [Agathobacter rectalis]
MLRIPYEQLPLSDDFSIVPSDYYKANGGVVFPNPNAPTGKLMPLDEIEDIIEHNQDVIVVVDEAYVDFGGSALRSLTNMIMSSWYRHSQNHALAGSRVGFAMASPVLIKYLNDVKYSFNSYTMDRITIEAATAAVKDRAYFEETTAKVIKTREWTKTELKRLGFTFCDSMSNFIFAKPANVSATKLFEDLKADNIFVRHFSSPERINDYLRISIGTDEQMHTLIKFLENYSC